MIFKKSQNLNILIIELEYIIVIKLIWWSLIDEDDILLATI